MLQGPLQLFDACVGSVDFLESIDARELFGNCLRMRDNHQRDPFPLATFADQVDDHLLVFGVNVRGGFVS